MENKMKFLLTMLLAVMAIASYAKLYNATEWKAVDKKDDDAIIAYWADVTDRQSAKFKRTIYAKARRDNLNAEQLKAMVDTEAVIQGITDADLILLRKVQVILSYVKDYQSALDLCLTGTGRHTKAYLGHCYIYLKRYDEGVKAFEDSANLYYASLTASRYNIGKAKQFALASQALLAKRLSVAKANRIFNILTDIDLDEADVSEADYKKLLKKLKRKYSKTVKTTVDGVTKREYVYEDMRATIIDLLKDL
jgi:tetratricopeptide (TPR) repeat protein